MDCEKCGADVPEGAETCPECGETMPAVAEETTAPASDEAPEASADEAPKDDASGEATEAAEGEPAEGEAVEGEPEAVRNKFPTWLTAVIGIIVVAALGVGGYFLVTSGILGPLVGNDPSHAATRMLTAYANYDAQGILDNATHGTLPPSGIADFTKQAADAKQKAGGKPGLKDIKVVKVDYDAKDPNRATVNVSASWLVDPAKGTYETRTEQLKMVKVNGKWVVELFI